MKTRCLSGKRIVGFTLIEVLAAVSIMAVLILGVLTITTNVLNSWTRSNDQLISNYEARVALDIIAQDLEAAVIRRNGSYWLQVDYSSVSGYSTPQASLYFFSPVLTRDPDWSGDICMVAYKVDYKNPFTLVQGNMQDTNTMYGLYRLVVRPESTFSFALAEAANSELGAVWLVPEVQAPILDLNSFLSANVANFVVRALYTEPDEPGVQMTPDPASGAALASFYIRDGLYVDGDKIEGAKVVGLEISLTVLGNEGANQARVQGNLDDDLLNRYGAVFTRRVNLVSGSL